MRNVLDDIPQGEKSLASALLRTIFTQPSRRDADLQWQQVSDQMSKRWPQAAALMDDAQQDVCDPLTSLTETLLFEGRVIGLGSSIFILLN